MCRRFEIDNSARTLHGALLDAELLAEGYLELIGGRQPGLILAAETSENASTKAIERVARVPRPHQPTAKELAAHAEFIARLNDPLWEKSIRINPALGVSNPICGAFNHMLISV